MIRANRVEPKIELPEVDLGSGLIGAGSARGIVNEGACIRACEAISDPCEPEIGRGGTGFRVIILSAPVFSISDLRAGEGSFIADASVGRALFKL